MNSKSVMWVPAVLVFGLLVGGCAGKQPVQPIPSFQSQSVTGETYRQKADNLVFLLDASSSMCHSFNENEKFNIARNVVANFNQSMPDMTIKTGLRSFGHSLCYSWESTVMSYGMTEYSRQGLADALNAVSPAGGPTPMDKAFKAAAEDLKATQGNIAMVVVSDGEDLGKAPLKAAKDLGSQYSERLCVYTVLVGDDEAGRALLAEISGVTGCGKAVAADDVAAGPAMADFVTTVLFEKVKTPALGVFKDIKFEVDKDILMASSYATLDEIVKILKQHPDLSVEIQGHTDSTASEAYNMDLSIRRAVAVMKYLESMGIAGFRMRAKGYGEGFPIDTNATPEGKANNRRVELKPLQ